MMKPTNFGILQEKRDAMQHLHRARRNLIRFGETLD
jgi:hypothetical protein